MKAVAQAMAKKTLVTWIGLTDLKAYGSTLPPSKRASIEKITGPWDADKAGQGPVKSLVDQEQFARVHVLSNFDRKVTTQFCKWLQQKHVIHHVELQQDQVTNHGRILDVVKPVLDALKLIKEDELCFHLSPGTPAMSAVWILLGKSVYPATLFQTSIEGGVSKAEIPFDITTDVLPQLLRDPDRLWQHLTSKSPQEISGFRNIIGDSEALRLAVGRAERAAISDVRTIILGETGTGKELFATAIHNASERKDKPILGINCAAFTDELLLSELFGHAAGAFTGADSKNRKKGLFEEANNGTLFLDEVGECSLAMQSMLLRALQPPQGEDPNCCVVRPVGATGDKYFNVRVLSATNKDMVTAVKNHEFRADLLHRLNTVTIKLPPLRERGKDICVLAARLLEGHNERFKRRKGTGGMPGYVEKSLSRKAEKFINTYPWPGNVRQLDNSLLQAVVLTATEILEPEHLLAAIADTPESVENILGRPLGEHFNLEEILNEVKLHYYLRALSESGEQKTKTAELLGINSRGNLLTLQKQLKKARLID